MNNSINYFALFEGTWVFNRSISGSGTSAGKATYIKEGSDTLLYREDGLFTNLDGVSFQNFRMYCYRLENGLISVYFTDGKPFHTLQFDGDKATGHHLCACDHYDAEYLFEAPDRFRLSYKVKGPKKDYTIETLFQKIA